MMEAILVHTVRRTSLAHSLTGFQNVIAKEASRFTPTFRVTRSGLPVPSPDGRPGEEEKAFNFARHRRAACRS